jgi:threonine dehydrogenase-like Zn-dependent dehydrogenase
MRAAVFVERGRIELADKAIPDVGPNDALIRITTTTICGTDIHILKGEYPVAKGLTPLFRTVRDRALNRSWISAGLALVGNDAP